MNKTTSKDIVKLLAIIVILLVFILALVGTSLTLSSSREDAFRTEANKILDATSIVISDNLELTNDAKSCKVDDSSYCITVDYLTDNKLYSEGDNTYTGKVIYNIEKETHELYLKKNDEFKIIGGLSKNYNKSGTLSYEEWLEEYSICECE